MHIYAIFTTLRTQPAKRVPPFGKGGAQVPPKMKRFPYPTAKVLLASVATLSLGWFSIPKASAASYTFTGTGDWYTAGTSQNWSPTVTNGLSSNFLNVTDNSVIINGAVNYNSGAAGGDFMVGNGDTMTISGSTASWTQLTGAYVKIGAAGGTTVTSTVDVTNGGFFNVFSSTQLRIGQDGGAGNFVVESTGGGLNIAGTNNGTAYSTLLGVASGSTVSLLGGTNSLGEVNNSGTVTFGGGGTTTAQWDNAAGTYKITGGTVTATNYDMNTAGAAFNSTGGTLNFTGNFTNLRTVTISGGAVSVAGTFNTNASTNVAMTGGSLTKTGSGNVNLNAAATFTLSGTAAFAMTGSGEFQPGGTFTTGQASNQSISGNATINIAGLVAFQSGATTKFDINGGALTLGGSTGGGGTTDGIYSAGGYFNFTQNSTGTITFSNVGNGEHNIFEGQIRYNDATYTSANYSLVFDVEHPTATSTTISLLGASPVPEPGTWAAGALLLGVAGWMRLRTLRGMLSGLPGAQS